MKKLNQPTPFFLVPNMLPTVFPHKIIENQWCCGMPGCTKQIDVSKKSLIVYHKNTHNPKYKCEHCAECFPQKSRLEVHVRTTHTGEKPYKCDHCEKAFPQMSNLNDHVKKNHMDVEIIPKKVKVAPAPKIDYAGLYPTFYKNEMDRLKKDCPSMAHPALVSEVGRLWRLKKETLLNENNTAPVPGENPGPQLTGVTVG